MALIDCKDPVFDRKVDQVLKMLEEGIDRAEIAKKLGYSNPISMDNYMRRRNFSWDSREKNFVPAAERYSCKGRDNLVQMHGTSKAALIISLFEQGESDAKDIARQVGLVTHTDLANYMMKKGYEWDTRIGNYTKKQKDVEIGNFTEVEENSSVAKMIESMMPLLKTLQDNPPHKESFPLQFRCIQLVPSIISS